MAVQVVQFAGKHKPPTGKFRVALRTDTELPAKTDPIAPIKNVRLTILVVDDVEDTRAMYARYLQFVGMRVQTAMSGTDALQVVLRERPDAIALDLAMPGGTGWDVLRTLRLNTDTRRIPIVVVSGQNARESAMNAGADLYIEKPCHPDDLCAALLSVLPKRH
jgi:CheY-like chemotaxis protein